MKIDFLGDVHGKLSRIPQRRQHPMVQVGDLGVGFVKPYLLDKYTMAEGLHFIRGNHDYPDGCRAHPRYLGEFGVAPASLGGFFFVSGAWSIDHAWRMEGRDWWLDEELSAAQGRDAFDAYAAARPRVMVTHDGPASLFEPGGPMALAVFHRSSTATLLQAMLEAHSPELWIFGHHHVSRHFTMGRTLFRCLDELETATFDV